MKRHIIYIIGALLLMGCTPTATPPSTTIYVSILPLKSLAKAIVDEDFPIEVLVPPGASPETFEPTPKQYIALNEAQRIFSVGLIDFETTLLGKLDAPERVVNLSQGIELIAGSCSHHHHGHHHAHGIDPHIWTSPRALQQMAENLYTAIHTLYPDSVRYTQNHQRLQADLQALDVRARAQIEQSGMRKFIVYHPALTYYARDYGLQQLSIEQDGKEPSARQLAELIRQARSSGIRTILYQQQFPSSSVEVIASDIEGQAIAFDPLAEDIIHTIDHITSLITKP